MGYFDEVRTNWRPLAAATAYLYEVVVPGDDRGTTTQVLKDLDAHVHRGGGELIEAQVTAQSHRIFAVAEFDGAAAALDARCWGLTPSAGPTTWGGGPSAWRGASRRART